MRAGFWRLGSVLMLFGAAAPLLNAAAVLADDTAPKRQRKPIAFDAAFARSLTSAEFHSPELRSVEKKMRQYSPKKRGFTEKNFIVFVELMRQFADYAREFSSEKDRVYGNLGDFKAYYYRVLSSRYPWIRLHGEFLRLTVASDALQMKVQGGGGGARIDLTSERAGQLSVVFLPIYGEQRKYRPTNPENGFDSKTDWLLRMSAGASYEYSVSNGSRAGVQILYQPQVYDLGQYRVYAETYIRFRVYKGGSSNRYRIEEIYFVPKVIYWYSSDREGLLGDRIEDIFGSAYAKLDENFFGFFHLEFRFAK